MTLRDFFTITTWWGKILGAIFGYLIAQAPGALIGILIGNVFDRGLAEHFSKPYWRYHAEERPEVQEYFLFATFTILGYLAKSDGRVSEYDIAAAKQLMTELRLSSKQKARAKQSFTQGKQPQFNATEVLSQFMKIAGQDSGLLKTFIDIQYRFAASDILSFPKIRALNHILKQLGFAPLHQQYQFYQDFGDAAFSHRPHAHEYEYEQTQQNQSQSQSQSYQHQYYNRSQYQQGSASSAQTTLTQAYTLLGVTPQSTKTEVKRAYRKLISQNHPDKLIAKGSSAEAIKIANDKTQCITKAYETICTYKGW